MTDDLSALLDEAWPSCPFCGEQLEDAGTEAHPYFVCGHCTGGVIRRG